MKKINLLLLWVLCQFSTILVGVVGLWSVFRNPVKAKDILLAYDRLANAAANDTMVQTISKRAAKASQDNKPWGKLMCRFLNLFQKDHCQRALNNE